MTGPDTITNGLSLLPLDTSCFHSNVRRGAAGQLDLGIHSNTV